MTNILQDTAVRRCKSLISVGTIHPHPVPEVPPPQHLLVWYLKEWDIKWVKLGSGISEAKNGGNGHNGAWLSHAPTRSFPNVLVAMATDPKWIVYKEQLGPSWPIYSKTWPIPGTDGKIWWPISQALFKEFKYNLECKYNIAIALQKWWIGVDQYKIWFS